MTTVFQVLTGENWNAVLYDGIRSVGWSSVAYYVSLFVVGHIIVLTLFLAVLLHNFAGGHSTSDSADEGGDQVVTRPRGGTDALFGTTVHYKRHNQRASVGNKPSRLELPQLSNGTGHGESKTEGRL